MLNTASPMGFLVLMLGARVDALRDTPRSERGASAVEWIIIAAIVVGICGAVAIVLRNALTSEAGEIAGEITSQ